MQSWRRVHRPEAHQYCFIIQVRRGGVLGRDEMMHIEMHCGFACNSLTLHIYLRSMLSMMDASLLQCPVGSDSEAAVSRQLCVHLGQLVAATQPEASAAAPPLRELAFVGTANWLDMEADPALRARVDVALRVR